MSLIAKPDDGYDSALAVSGAQNSCLVRSPQQHLKPKRRYAAEAGIDTTRYTE